MQRLLITLIAFSMGLSGQTNSGIARHITYGAVLPATCSPATGDVFFLTSAGPTGALYTCTAVNTWTAAGGGGGSQTPWTSNINGGGYNLSNVGAVSVGNTLLSNIEYSNGTCTTGATINPANGNKQKITLTNAQTCALTFTQPTLATVTLQIKIVQSSSGSFNGLISGGLWPGGTVPTITATSAAVDFIVCYLDGTSTYCQAGQNFK